MTKNSKNINKPGRAVRSRKMSRAPQPPNSETPATNKQTVTSPSSAVQRPCQTHSFHTDAAEVQQMETVLLKLLDDFNSGKLRAFGQGCSMEQMSSIRDQQESLAKLHFDLGAKQDPAAPLSDEGIPFKNQKVFYFLIKSTVNQKSKMLTTYNINLHKCMLNNYLYPVFPP